MTVPLEFMDLKCGHDTWLEGPPSLRLWMMSHYYRWLDKVHPVGVGGRPWLSAVRDHFKKEHWLEGERLPNSAPHSV